MTLTVASFNIRKAIGTDRKRRPERVLSVLEEIGADIIALQEADKRVGTRGAAVPHELIDDHGHWQPVDFDVSHGKLLDILPDHPVTAPMMGRLNTRNLGWHGNAILVRKGTRILDAEALDLPTLEPRGAVMVELEVDSGPVRIIGMHLDLSGLYRKKQVDRIVAHIEARHAHMPTIVMGDSNDWRPDPPCFSAFSGRFRLADCGPSFHSRKPMAALDRIIVDKAFEIERSGVHRSAAARKASDHLPVWARLKR
ncbi:endonuclease/exonuclease/phosphatase family protein [Sphingomicrobium lutaoense]|uniref:Endonuclease/exonuclease/phosphatase family metal-dependent hydrolase n=1 Tax=Sphingomicrobium lutaoense TaxID=515949 RepID=A0A839Z0H8_9SPHN|nr:endonuclease/exonuclease/phosphatase family protein [Sphingomicrobium lutaoense]MBB3764859.1 endonuclease/exonuclease/phosphatase family metal-dependent hydrolase [Sphingomicrobium lutaoense]